MGTGIVGRGVAATGLCMLALACDLVLPIHERLVPAESPSCRQLTAGCGLADADCCASPEVEGGTFYRSYDGIDGGPYTSMNAPATVSTFRLDRFEITVGRFRAFAEAYPYVPLAGSGKNPNDPGDKGWDPSFNSSLPGTAPELENPPDCQGTFDPTPGPSDELPLTCITWYEAFAFCIWDGGRLPTEAEWNYAASGGAQQRVFPWSSPPNSTVVGADYVAFGGIPVQVVGSLPMGDGLWGQSDLSGNVWELVRDYYSSSYPLPCTNCANEAPDSGQRSDRGGCFGCTDPRQIYTSYRGSTDPMSRRGDTGARCARDGP